MDELDGINLSKESFNVGVVTGRIQSVKMELRGYSKKRIFLDNLRQKRHDLLRERAEAETAPTKKNISLAKSLGVDVPGLVLNEREKLLKKFVLEPSNLSGFELEEFRKAERALNDKVRFITEENLNARVFQSVDNIVISELKRPIYKERLKLIGRECRHSCIV